MSGPAVGEPTVVTADPRTDERWGALAATTQGSLFTSPPWIRAVCDTYGFDPCARIAIDGQGRPTDGFAWVTVGGLREDRLVSLPFCDRAEPFVSDPAVALSLMDDALDSAMPFTLRCFDSASPSDERLVRTKEAAWHGSSLGTTVSELHRSLSSGARRNIAAAHANGVRVEAFTGMDAVSDYHRLHVSLRRRKYRLLAQPLELFERIWAEFSARDGIVTLLAYLDEQPIAGAIYLAWGDTLYYKFGASLAETLPLRPNDAIFWNALCWANEHGFRTMDWGLSDLDQPGLVAYKRKWGSTERRIVTLRSPGPDREPSGGKGNVLAELTDLLTEDAVPDHIAARAGAILYRYFA
jgi:CelD/BcsL family acetyltransferase involved in cellulose biosynthesis